MKRIFYLSFVLAFFCTAYAYGARLKDIADIEGVRGNQLFGYGLVVGLNGTGDGNGVDFAVQSLSNMLEKMGVRVEPDDLKVKNVAAVMVTAELPPFVRPGTHIDVTVSSLGDAKSLEGGMLVFTPLKGADGNVYAVAQGSVTVGGFAVGAGGDSAQKNHPTVGIIAEGAIVERAIPFDLFQSKRIRIVLRHPDFTTMTRVVREINLFFGKPLARAVDAASVEVPITGKYAPDPIGLVAQLEAIQVEQDVGAKVVVNERTGTIIIGENVTINTIALAHGNLHITVRSETQVSQPPPLAQTGQTQVVTNADIKVSEEGGNFAVVKKSVTLRELVDALNSLGATPRDLISIFNALKRAGALNAELVVM
ncbi:MAG: flagellar basal body P-ring protein FlgI [Candidatus Dadabacteria bacterium]|nr:MAG: flagellar basal body P-ring protein FlgI [Candidatus Dadabacteria bacterium]